MVFCAVYGCSHRNERDNCSFFRIPTVRKSCTEALKGLLRKRRHMWIQRINRKDFSEMKANASRVCSHHFISGKPSKLRDTNNPDWAPSLNLGYNRITTENVHYLDTTGRPSHDQEHPDYVPNIFTFKPSKKPYKKLCEKKNEKSIQEMHQEDPLQMDLKFEEVAEEENEKLILEMHQEDHLHTDLKFEDSSQNEELSSLKLELQQVRFTLCTMTEDRDQLKKDLSSANLTQSSLQNSLSEKEEELSKHKEELQQAYTELNVLRREKEEELSKLKKELQQAYTELNVLRREKEELQEKLSTTDITQSILQDPKKLSYYTGLSSLKDFRIILSLLSVENNVRLTSLETQALIVLMKLKLNLCYQDLAYRFKCSISTVQRIWIASIPILEEKLNMLVKNPINAALRKNIPVNFKNTVYENLYHRVQRNLKLRTKQEEESIDSNEM